MLKYFILLMPFQVFADDASVAQKFNPADYSNNSDEDADLAEAIANSKKTHNEERAKMSDEELAQDNAYGNNTEE